MTLGVCKARRNGGRQMHVALQIDLALWGMIICAGIKAAQFLEVFSPASNRKSAKAAQHRAIAHAMVMAPANARNAQGHRALSHCRRVAGSCDNFCSMANEREAARMVRFLTGCLRDDLIRF